MRPYALQLLVGCLWLLALTSCSNEPTRTYVLTADVEKAGPTTPGGIAVEVGPISLPAYLDRPQIVTRTAPNSVVQADLDQWGGNLNDNIVRVLAINLSNLLMTDRISLYPSQDGPSADFQVVLNIERFEEQPDGNTVLDTFWSLVNPGNGKVLVMRRSSYQAADGSTQTGHSAATQRPYDAVAAAMSRNLADLSRDIGREINALKGAHGQRCGRGAKRCGN
jgi:uncharacterized protein